MTAIIEHTLHTQICDAVDIVRSARHFPGCPCAMYRDDHNAPFCTSRESTWSRILDRLLDKARG